MVLTRQDKYNKRISLDDIQKIMLLSACWYLQINKNAVFRFPWVELLKLNTTGCSQPMLRADGLFLAKCISM